MALSPSEKQIESEGKKETEQTPPFALLLRSFARARDWIRTSTPFRAPPPQGGASTNFATRAYELIVGSRESGVSALSSVIPTHPTIPNTLSLKDCKYNGFDEIKPRLPNQQFNQLTTQLTTLFFFKTILKVVPFPISECFTYMSPK